MLDINKRFVSDTVTQNPYFERCTRQAVVVSELQEQVRVLLQKRKCTHDLAMRIRIERQKYERLENQFFSRHKKNVDKAHIMEGKAWQDR